MNLTSREAEWLAARSDVELALSRCTPKQYRKWRLFGVACCRWAMTLTPPDPQLETLAVCAERFADGLGTWNEVKRARRTLPGSRSGLEEAFGPGAVKLGVIAALDQTTKKAASAPLLASSSVRSAFGSVIRPDYYADADRAEQSLLSIARDIFGNPFRPVVFDPEWRSDTALSLAKHSYDARDFAQMPILADALQDAGCDNAEILSHCRDANATHVRGCWVVDMILGKS
jgi:hypothetical protein